MKVATPGLYLLEEDERDYLQQLVKTCGLASVARLLDVSRGAVSSAVAGIGVRRGSAEMISVGIARHRKKEAVSK